MKKWIGIGLLIPIFALAIGASKKELNLPGFTASRALVVDANNQLAESATTLAELAYVSGVTSSIQTQIGTKITEPGSVANGDVLYYNSGWQRLAAGSEGEVLKLASGIPSWATDAGGGATVTSIDNTDSPYTLLSTTDILLVDASSAAVAITFPDASTVGAGWSVTIKVIATSLYDVTLSRATTDLIEGETEQVLSTPGIAFDFFSDGTSDFYAY